MSALISLKQMAEKHANTVGKVTIFRINPLNIRVVPGFNARDEGPELDAYIDAMKAAIRAGATLPPLDVFVEDGEVWAVDGHCRRRSYCELIEEGYPVESVEVRKFEGDEAERTAHMLTSAQQRSLSMLEQGKPMADLVRFGWSAQKIADRRPCSVAHVEQCLMLFHADMLTKSLVRGGQVSPKAAIAAIRKHGNGAGKFLSGVVASTSGKVTPSKIAAPTLTPKLAARAAVSMAGMFAHFAPERLKAIRTAEPDEVIQVRAADLQALLEIHDSHTGKAIRKAEKETAKLAA